MPDLKRFLNLIFLISTGLAVISCSSPKISFKHDQMNRNIASLSVDLGGIKEMDIYTVNLISEEPIAHLPDGSILAQEIEFNLSYEECQNPDYQSELRASCYFKIKVPPHTTLIGIAPASEVRKNIYDKEHTQEYTLDSNSVLIRAITKNNEEGNRYIIITVGSTTQSGENPTFLKDSFKKIGKVKLTVSALAMNNTSKRSHCYYNGEMMSEGTRIGALVCERGQYVYRP